MGGVAQEEQIGFVGLGTMGAPMAGHLLSAEHLMVWNRTPIKAKPLLQLGASQAETLEEIGKNCSLIFLCVSRSEDVVECMTAMKPVAKEGTLFVDHSTISPRVAQALHQETQDHGLRFLDAPVTGGSMGAHRALLTVFCGGDRADFERARPFMTAYSRRCELVGGPGAGQLMKMANQIAVGGSLLALCEAMSFAEKAKLDLSLTRELLAGGAAGSWALDNYGPKILIRDWSPGFSIKNQRKDFAYCVETAKEASAAVPGTLLVDRLLAELEKEGRNEEATVALFEKMLEMGFEA